MAERLPIDVRKLPAQTEHRPMMASHGEKKANTGIEMSPLTEMLWRRKIYGEDSVKGVDITQAQAEYDKMMAQRRRELSSVGFIVSRINTREMGEECIRLAKAQIEKKEEGQRRLLELIKNSTHPWG